MQNNTKSGYAAIVGKPNAGKSTLMNAAIGAKLSIVTPKPQTTRKQVLGIYSDENAQIIFIDTPGVLNPKYELQKVMMGYVGEALETCDLVLFLIDLSNFGKVLDAKSIEILEELKKLKKPIIAVINKIDTYKDIKDVLPVIAYLSTLECFKEIVPISALKNASVDNLIKLIIENLPDGDFFYDPEQIGTQSERFFVSEIIREQIFKMFAQEIPYSTEVNISEFKEREDGKWYIAADIIVDRKSQKSILIGSGGSQIKRIGEKARVGIEEHLQTEVFLDLFVKVRESWRNNKNMLKSYGY